MVATFCYFQFSSPSLGLWMWWPQGSYICLTRWLQDFPGIASYLCYLKETYGKPCLFKWSDIPYSLIIFQFSKDPDSRSSSNKVMVIIYMNLIKSKLFTIPKQGYNYLILFIAIFSSIFSHNTQYRGIVNNCNISLFQKYQLVNIFIVYNYISINCFWFIDL